jgi:Leucine-rich repeat (LRR) protein
MARRLPVPARHQKEVNAALAPYVEVRSGGGGVISRPPPPTAASALSANEGDTDAAQVVSFRPQFSLKAMLLLVLTAGFGCSWAALHFKPYREQMRIVKELERFDPEPNWVGGQLYSLDFSDSKVKIGDEQLSQLAQLTTLETLDLGDCPITDEGLRHLSQLPRLEMLILNGTQVTDAGLVHLEALPHLTYVSLGQTNVTGEGVERLRQALPGADIHN